MKRGKRSALVEMKVAELTVDPLSNMPILVLRDAEGELSVPIWIGLIEASAIATELEKIALSRPMTHDLMREMVRRLGGEVSRVEIRDVRDGTFYATVVLVSGAGRTMELDARPSDAIALALRCCAPVLVTRSVIAKAAAGPPAHTASAGSERPTDGLHYRELLESLADEDFGKWKM
jgi:uncharacterized protein